VLFRSLNQHRGLKIPLVLSGDTHNYSRYVGDDNHTQFITSGGGGAFILFVGFWSYTKKQEGGGAKVFFVSAGNALLHSLAVIFIALFFSQANEIYLGRTWPRFSFLLFAAEMIVVGGVIAAALFGGYLYASSRWWNLNHNDAFSSMRLDSHRNFLRIRIKDDELTIYPIGLDRVPRRHEWRFNTQRAGTPPPVYVPVSPLTPHLIETPIAVRSWEGSQGPHAAASA